MLLAGAVQRRLRGKQSAPYPPPPGPAPGFGNPVLTGVAKAIRAEELAADGLLLLPWDARRFHIHWTHSRTHNPQDVQPHQLTREDFWNHLVRCYKEAYPKADSHTGSPLEFGLVCKELHKDAPREEDRSEHHHTASYSSQQLYWRKIAKLSHEKYHIKLNAVAHDAYVTMYKYPRVPSSKKLLHELDSQPFFSEHHPQGDRLKELLMAGSKYLEVRSQRQQASVPREPITRSQFGVVFNWIVDHNLRGPKGVGQLKVDALSELKAGRPKLIDFIKKHKSCLRDQLDFCWELMSAGSDLQRLSKTRVEILLEAATNPSSRCANGNGCCADIYNDIVSYQGIRPAAFQHSLFETLLHGRRKGNVFMVVGGQDTGKTTVTDPARLIFKCMPTPQADSFCPLQDARGYEVFLWQDFRYFPGHPREKEQGLRLDEGTWNRLAEGLPTLIGVAKTDGSRGDFVYDEDAAFILTGPFKMTAFKNGFPDERETDQLACRVKYWIFPRAAPEKRDRSFEPCPLCWSRWVLDGELRWQGHHGVQPDDFALKVIKALFGTTPASPATSGPTASAGSTQAAAMPSPVLPDPTGGAATQGSLSAPAVGTAAQGPVATNAVSFFAELSQLVAWRTQGLLSDTEFVKAKQKLGI